LISSVIIVRDPFRQDGGGIRPGLVVILRRDPRGRRHGGTVNAQPSDATVRCWISGSLVVRTARQTHLEPLSLL
jgi:hypothetical protein